MPLNQRLKRALRSAWVGSFEALLGVAVVGLLSLIFLGALQSMFPEGTGLVDLYGGLVGGERMAAQARPGFADGSDPPIVARLSQARRQVKDRLSDAVVWSASREGMAVEHQHAIQTLARSGATIVVAGRGDIEMDENSLIVFRQSERGNRGERRRATIALLGGTIRGSVPSGEDGAAGVDIVTAQASTRVQEKDGKPVDYSVSVGPDNSSIIKIFSGNAEVTAGEARTELEPGEAVTVFPDQTIGPTVRIAPAPGVVGPADRETLAYGAVVPEVPFRWSAVEGAEAYRLVIATDDGFEAVVYDGVREETAFDHGALEAGRYYWRISAIRDGLEGRHSAARALALEQDLEPPTLAVELVPAADGELIVRGTTEPGAEVYAGTSPMPVSSSGVFEYRVRLEAGVNMIVVEAVDTVGNSAYYSEYVDAQGIVRLASLSGPDRHPTTGKRSP